jgi:chromosome segregation ATPase
MEPNYLATNKVLRRLAEQSARMGQPPELPTLKTVRRGGYDPEETRAVFQQWQEDIQNYVELVTFLRSELSATTRVLGETKASLDVLTERAQALEAENLQLKQEVEWYRSTGGDAPALAAYESDRVRLLEAERDQALADLAALQAKAAAWEEENGANSVDGYGAWASMERSKTEEELRTRLAAIEAERDELLRAREADQAELDTLRAQLSQLREESDPLLIQAAILSAQRFAAQLRAEAEQDVQQYLSSMQEVVAAQQQTLERLTAEVAAVRARLAEELHRETDALRTVLDHYVQEAEGILAAGTDRPAPLYEPRVRRLERWDNEADPDSPRVVASETA